MKSFSCTDGPAASTIRILPTPVFWILSRICRLLVLLTGILVLVCCAGLGLLVLMILLRAIWVFRLMVIVWGWVCAIILCLDNWVACF